MRGSYLAMGTSLLLLVLLGGLLAYYYPQLPERMASHFDAQGNPDGWMEKPNFVVLCLLATGMVVASTLLPVWLMPYLPASLLNIPHKEYWLSDEHRNEAISILRFYLSCIACGTILLLAWMFYETIQVNLNKQDGLRYPFISLAVYLGFVAACCWGMWRQFRLPGAASSAD